MRESKANGKTILYYPTIKIEDGYWLRNAILYWDNVASIVPGFNYNEFNSPEVEYLRDAGIYKSIYPIELNCNEELVTQFCGEVKEKLKQNRSRNKNEEISRIHREKLAMSQRGMLHINKMPESILDFLKDEGIAMENCEGPWINMKTRDAQIYMSILAKYLAKIEDNTDIGTDIAEKFYYPYAKAKGNEIEKQICLDMALQNILPTPNMDNTPIESIIDFRVEHKRELHYFRRRIELFQDSLKAQTEDIKELQAKIIRFKKEIDEDLKLIEELLKRQTISYKLRSWRTLLPIGLNAGVGVAAILGEWTEIGVLGAETMAAIIMALFCAKEPKKFDVSDSNAYLFYAKRSEMIK